MSTPDTAGRKMQWFTETVILMLMCAAATEGCGREELKPKPPSNRNPIISCPDIPDVTADSGSTTKRVYWASPSARDDQPGWDLFQTGGEKSGSLFSEGSHNISYRVIDSGGLVDQCYRSFEVRVTTCDAFSKPYYGSYICNIDKNIYGRRCNFSCKDGYLLNGASSTVCESNGNYSHSPPVCQKKKCNDFSLPNHAIGKSCTIGRYFESVCTITCNYTGGYTPAVQSYAQCMANTQWSFSNLICEDTEKPNILNCPESEMKTSDPNYAWPDISATDNSGSVNLTQTKSRHEKGTQLIRYEAVDNSGNAAHFCEFAVTYKPPMCPPPKPLADDKEPTFICMNHTVGTHCQASCRLVPRVGSEYLECRQTGGVPPASEYVPVDGEFPTCYKKKCYDLPAPTNGVLACDKFLGGMTCQVLCNKAYDLPISMKDFYKLSCFMGEWTKIKKPPGCTEKAYPDHYLRATSYYFSGNCSDETTQKQIKKAFIENFKRRESNLCITETCNFENVEVMCGLVNDSVAEWDFTRRRRDVVGIKPPLQYNYDSSFDTTNTTTNTLFSPSPDVDSSGYMDGSGEHVKTRFRTAIKFIFAVKNVSKSMSDAMVVDLFKQITNSSILILNGTDEKVEFDTSTFEDVWFECGPGKAVSSSSATLCVSCPAGSFQNHSSGRCELCPLNSYSHMTGQTSCTSCDQLWGTLWNGSSSREDCKAMCLPGEFSKTGFAPCSPCQLGLYQSEHFQTSCKQCPGDSSTANFGASSVKDCQAFDLMVKGPVQLNFGSVIQDWVEELTVAFWVKILPHLDHTVNVSLTFSHPTRGHQLTWYLRDSTGITMRYAPVDVKTQIRPNIWTHMALVWKGYPSFVDMHMGGKRKQHYGGHTPLCFLPQGTELTIHIGNYTGATIREVYVIPRSNTSGLIASMAKKCSPGDIGYRSLVSNIKPSNPSLISMVVPSVCSEINRCDPSPCPGHHCKSLPHVFKCVCKGGYSGRDCSIPPDFCVLDNKCRNGGTCSNTNTSIKCTCTDDFKGQYCETAIVHGNWGPWASWSQCSLTCGGGKSSRTRLCNYPVPEPELGKPCQGEATAMSLCNTRTCPECRESQLLLGKGVKASCVKAADGSMTCSVTCAEGLVFPGPEPSYKCKNEFWTPSNKTVSCVEFSIPETVKFKYSIPYKTRLNNTENDIETITKQATTCASNTSCVAEETCTFKVTVETCIPGEEACGGLVEGYKAVIAFSAPVQFVNDNLLMSQQKLKDAWESLNAAYNDLEAIYEECFLVQLSSGPVKPGTSIAKSDLTCERGTVPNLGYCSACEPGTKYTNQTCVLCAKGWYQEDTGQSSCNACPAATNTAYQGSTLVSECRAPPPDAFLLLTDSITGQVWRVNASSFLAHAVTLPSGFRAQSAGYDPISQQIIYVDKLTSVIRGSRNNHTQTYVKLNWAASVDDIAIDPISRLIFYTDKGNDVIGVVTIATKYHKIVVRYETFLPKHIVLDPVRGIIYWIDWGPYQLIERAQYDGAERKMLMRSSNLWPQGLTLDTEEQKLYWTEGSGKSLQVMDVDGSNRRTVLTSDSYYPFSLTIFNSYIFYSLVTPNNSIIMRSNMDGSGLWKTELPPFKFISDMKAHRSNYLNAGTNGCVENNGGCPYFCFPRFKGQRDCGCPEGYTTHDNKVDCVKNAVEKTHWWDEWMQPRHRRSAMSPRHH